MAKMQEFKCPCCGGSIEFDSSVQKMKCPFCDTEFDVGTLSEYAQTVEEEQPEDMSWSDEAGSEWRDGESEGLRTYVCKSCGGEKCPFDFQRKMLETFTEIYLCFGIRARDHKLEKDPAGGLKAYLEEIKQAIIKERGKINAGVKTD